MRPPERQSRPTDNRAASESFGGDTASIPRRWRPILEVEIESRHCARLRGRGARALVVELKGRPPVWSSIARAFTVSEVTARDVIALAELHGYDVVVNGPRGVGLRSAERAETVQRVAQFDPGGLW
jgi:hypothetical protein